MQKQLHPGVKWQWRVTTWIMLLVVFMFFGSWTFGIPIVFLFAAISGGDVTIIVLGVLITFVFLIGVIIVLTEVIVNMSYNRWFYEFTDDGLKLERGIIWKKYSNIPYERIQNVDVHRGIFARMLGFSTVMLQTAGFSAQPMAEGSLPAVEQNEAEQIREFVMKRITKKGRGQGL
jgi:uncharacterized protein